MKSTKRVCKTREEIQRDKEAGKKYMEILLNHWRTRGPCTTPPNSPRWPKEL